MARRFVIEIPDDEITAADFQRLVGNAIKGAAYRDLPEVVVRDASDDREKMFLFVLATLIEHERGGPLPEGELNAGCYVCLHDPERFGRVVFNDVPAWRRHVANVILDRFGYDDE